LHCLNGFKFQVNGGSTKTLQVGYKRKYRNGKITVERRTQFASVQVTTDFGMIVAFNGKSYAVVYFPNFPPVATDGLCGNNNHWPNDDLSGGTLIDHLNKWVRRGNNGYVFCFITLYRYRQ
jgi:hypothetical protein